MASFKLVYKTYFFLFFIIFSSSQVFAQNNSPPVCDNAFANPDSLWPPNHTFETVNIEGVTDPDGDAIAIVVDCVKQDEPINYLGDGNTEPHDASGIGTSSVQLRKEREGISNGRVYHVGFSASDIYGESCTGTVLVEVRHSKPAPAIDDGPLYDSVPQQGACGGEPINNPPTITSFPVINATATLNYSYNVEAADPDGDVLTYSLVQAPAGAFIDAATGVITWTPTLDQIGEHTVEIRVTDTLQGSDEQLFILTVSDLPNGPPEITSSPVLEAMDGQPYVYDVEAVDPDSDPLVYALTQAPDGMTIDDASGLIQWTPNPNQVGNQTVTVQVDDLRGGIVSQTFDVAVSPGNTAPAIISTPVIQVNATEAYNYDVDATDVDGDTLLYELIQFPTGMTIDSSTGVISWLTTASQQGQHTIQVRVTDGNAGMDTQSYLLDVLSPPNQPPEIVSQPVQETFVGVLYEYQVEAVDPDTGDVLNYSLSLAPAGMTIDATTGLIQWTPDGGQTGQQNVTVVVTDSGGLMDEQSFAVAVDILNAAPTIISTPVVSIDENTPYTYQVAASDPDGNILVYSLTAAPMDMTIDPDSGLISWSPAAVDIGPHAVTVVVTDPFGLSDDQSFILEVIDVNDPPQIISSPVTTGAENSLYQYDVEAVDPDNDNLTYSLLASPDGMTIDPGTGLIEWLPNFDEADAYSVSIQVTDEEGLSDTQDYALEIANTNRAPSVTSLPVTETSSGVLYQYDVQAQDPDGDALVYSLSSSPAGMTIDAQTGLIQWQPDTTGSFAVEISVQDGQGGSATQIYNVNVVAANQPPSITIVDPSDGFIFFPASDPVFFEGIANDPEDGDLSENIFWQSDIDGPLGTGATLAAVLSAGTHIITASVSDSASASVSETITIRVFEGFPGG